MSDYTIDDLARMYESGLSTVEISKLTGLDRSNLHKKLRRAGVTMRPQTTRKISDDREELLASGMSIAEVARRIGISESGLRAWIKRRGEHAEKDPGNPHR
jgi:DNA-directed RNA polymerase specialized sigma24 family protein